MSDLSLSYIEVTQSVMDQVSASAEKIVEEQLPATRIALLCAATEALRFNINSTNRDDVFIITITDRSLVTQREYESARRAIEQVCIHFNLNVSIKFKEKAAWKPSTKPFYRPKAPPTVSVVSSNTRLYVNLVKSLVYVDQPSPVLHSLMAIVLAAIELTRSSDGLYDDAFILHRQKPGSIETMEDGMYFDLETEMLYKSILDEVSKVSMKRFAFNART